MNVHTYKTYAYSGALQRMAILKLPYTYFYDPVAQDFDAQRVKQDLGGNQYINTLTPIPTGLAAWTADGLFTLTSRAGPWTKRPLTGAVSCPRGGGGNNNKNNNRSANNNNNNNSKNTKN